MTLMQRGTHAGNRRSTCRGSPAASPYTKKIVREIRKVIVGQDQVIEEMLIAIFSRGHCLLVGVPGLAKTLLVSTLAKTLSLSFKRIQFTPDLMPSDITGTEILAADAVTGVREFKFLKGPVFANLILADEINRTPPKTQAALLEAMQEKKISAGGTDFPLDEPFFVLATQNPIEQEGTYPLPEAQLDRFIFNILVSYPSWDEEIEIMKRVSGDSDSNVDTVLHRDDIIALQKVVRKTPVADHIFQYAARLVRSTRPGDPDAPPFIRNWLSYGAGPRASLFPGAWPARPRAVLRGQFHVAGRRYPGGGPSGATASHHPELFAARSEGLTPDGIHQETPGYDSLRRTDSTMVESSPPQDRRRYLDPETLQKIGSLELIAREVVEGIRIGVHKSPLRGFSTEFAHHRPYVPGDPIRHLDWRVFARTERYYLKQYEAETDFTAHLLLDASSSMHYRSGKVSKLEYAKYLAASLAYLIVSQRDSAGLAVFDSELKRYIEPLRVHDDHRQHCRRTGEGGAGPPRTNIAGILHEFAGRITRRGFVILISDLLDNVDAFMKGLDHLRFCGHNVIVFQTLDPYELTFPFGGSVKFKGLEEPGELLTRPQRVRQAYLEELDKLLKKIRGSCNRTGVDYVLVDTSKPVDVVISSYLMARNLTL